MINCTKNRPFFQSNFLLRRISTKFVKEAFDAALEKARQNRIERNNLRCEVRRKEIELQDLLISNLENR